MKIMRMAVMAAAVLFAAGALGDTSALRGSWKGPWYIGMSSGMAVLTIDEQGAGTITLTNLDEFGMIPVALAKQAFDGKALSFSATGANGAILSMNLQIGGNANQLRGNGKHAGFGARMELQRAD